MTNSPSIKFKDFLLPKIEVQALQDLESSSSREMRLFLLEEEEKIKSYHTNRVFIKDNHLTKIFIYDISIFPESIGNLTWLQALEVECSELPKLPESFGNLKNLEILELSNCKLTSLPKSFGNLKNLKKLELSKNNLSSVPNNFGDLQNLQDLNLEKNCLEMLPESFGNLENLKSLEIYGNKLKFLPESFSNLKKLENLELSSFLGNNQIENLPESFGNLKSLKVLKLNDNLLKSLPESFGNLESLEKLELDNNDLTHLPNSFGNLSMLKEAHLVDNKIKYLPEGLLNLKNLKMIVLGNNLIEELPKDIQNTKFLKKLRLWKNPIESKMYDLESLDEPIDYSYIDEKLMKARKNDFYYAYYVWLSKCPFCQNDVTKETIIRIDYKRKCPHCGSVIIVPWEENGASLIKRAYKAQDYHDVSFKKACQRLEQKDYFMVTFNGYDDTLETYLNIFYENMRFFEGFHTPDGNWAYLLRKNYSNKKIFIDDLIESRREPLVENWDDLIWLAFEEPGKIIEFSIDIEKRKEKVIEFKNDCKNFFKRTHNIRKLKEEISELRKRLKKLPDCDKDDECETCQAHKKIKLNYEAIDGFNNKLLF